eukprot:Nk52_evm41s248 gene=Nk52_evmTU41s248
MAEEAGHHPGKDGRGLSRGLSKFNDHIPVVHSSDTDTNPLPLVPNPKSKKAKQMKEVEESAYQHKGNKHGPKQEASTSRKASDVEVKIMNDKHGLSYEEKKEQWLQRQNTATDKYYQHSEKKDVKGDGVMSSKEGAIEIHLQELEDVEGDKIDKGMGANNTEEEEQDYASSLSTFWMLLSLLIPSSVAIITLEIPVDNAVWRFCVFRVGIDALAFGCIALLLLMTSTRYKSSIWWLAAWVLPLYCVLWPALSLWGYLFEPYHMIRTYAAWFMAHLVVCIIAGVVFMHVIDGTKDGWDKAWRAGGLLFTLTAQFFYSLVYGYYIPEITDTYLQALLCSGYPIVIGFFKIFEKKACQGDPDLLEKAEIVSVVLAGIPYRVVFLSADPWTSFWAIIAVEVFYKGVVYPSILSLRFHKLIFKLRKRMGKIGDEVVPEEYISKEMKMQQYDISQKFLYHNVTDTLSALGVLFLILYLRNERTQTSINALDSSSYERLVLQFIVSFFIEIAILTSLVLFIRFGMKSSHFRPWHHGRLSIRRLYPTLMAVTCATYLTIFIMLNHKESIPEFI